MKNITFIAPPAAGKGTQSQMLIDEFGLTHISTGHLARKAAEKNPEVKASLARGELLSDEVINELLYEALQELGDKLFILDGYPRRVEQAKTLDESLGKLKITNLVAIFLRIDKEEARQRILGRIICPVCGLSYNKHYQGAMPKVDGICDKCQVALKQRPEDEAQAFEKRFQEYLKNINPILDYYQAQGRLKEVECANNKEETYKRLKLVLDE